MSSFHKYNTIQYNVQYLVPGVQLEMHDEIFHFEIYKNFMKILKYFKTPF